MRGHCTPEQQACCPLQSCQGSDQHHLAYFANQYNSRVEKTWRELPINKIQVARCLHEAIHASGYVPEKPSKDEMRDEIQHGESFRSQAEREVQLEIGRAVLNGEYPEEAA